MDGRWMGHDKHHPLGPYGNQSFHPGLPLLKKLERLKLRDLHCTIEDQEYEQRMFPRKAKSLLQGKSWEWQADDGTWQSFEPAEQMRLENAVQMGQKTVTFVDSIHFMQTVDLTCMEMINMKSGQAKNIRRSPVLHYSIKQPVKCGPRENASTPYKPHGWNFSDNSEDEATSSEESSINFLGSSSLLPIVRRSGASAWSRHSKPRSLYRNTDLSCGRIRDTRYGASTKDKEHTRKRTSLLNASKNISFKTHLIHERTKNEDMNRMKKWLQKIELGEYFEKFRRERVSLTEVHALEENDLKKIGLPIGAQKRFFNAVKNLTVEKEPPDEYRCPITMALMKEPVVLSDGFTYEKAAIEKWLQGSNKSPMTNEALSSKVLTPNRQLKKLINDFKDLKASREQFM